MWTERRLGRFILTEEVLMPPSDHLWLMMRDLAILSAVWDAPNGRVAYLAWSSKFRELEEGEDAPAYVPKVTATKGIKFAEWQEVGSARAKAK